MSSVPVHGGLHFGELSELSLEDRDILDFSVNINPYGPSPRVLEAARLADLGQYSDPTAAMARAQLATHLGVESSSLCLGNGAAELMWSLARRLASTKRPALIVEPTFSEFTSAVRSAGGSTSEFRASEASGFTIDLAKLGAQIREQAPASVYICTPNNPTGLAMPMTALSELAQGHPDTVFLVDQAFLSLSSRHADRDSERAENMVLMRSLTKDHSIPGLRVAYMIGAPSLMADVEASRAPWTTSVPAQQALLASLLEDDFVKRCREKMLSDRLYLEERLRNVRLTPLASDAPYVLVRTGNASELRARLLARHGILVRDCSSFGLPDYIRWASRPNPDVDRLVTRLREELA